MRKRGSYYRAMGTAVFCAALLFCVSCGKEGRATDMKLARTEGQVEIQDEKEKTVTPEENLGLYSGYQVDTRQDSYAWVNLDKVKLTKMDQETAVEIRKSGKALELQVLSGSVYFNITEPLGEDETMEIRTSNMAVGIRGTIGWVECIDGEHMRVGVLEGTVQCTVTDPQTGQTAEESVSQGETALLICQPEKTEIAVEKTAEADLPEFVAEELRKDSQAADRVEEASGIKPAAAGTDSVESSETEPGEESESEPSSADENESEESESEENSVAALLQDYLDKELVPQYGYADLRAREKAFTSTDFYYEVDRNWTGISGIAEARILDLDSDGDDELLVIITEGQHLTMNVYEVENGVPVKRGELEDDRMEQEGMGDDCLYEKVFSLVEAGDTKYLLYTSRFSGFVTGDGYFSYVKLYRYDDAVLYVPLAVMQAYLGSGDFEYDAYLYDESGNVLSQERVYDDADYDNFGDAYCRERMKELFGGYGIGIGENASMINGESFFDGFLAPDVEHEEILKLRMQGEIQEEQAVYYFNR